MKRIIEYSDLVHDTPAKDTIAALPPGWYQRAKQAANLIPGQWDVLVVHPLYMPHPVSGWEYSSTIFRFYRKQGGRDLSSGFVIGDPYELTDKNTRENYLARIKYAFSHVKAKYSPLGKAVAGTPPGG